MEKKILYTTGISGILAVIIPKKYKDGYLKTAFGGHHINAKNRQFQNIMDDITGYWFQSDIYDVDGYLAFRGTFTDDQIETIIKTLITVFPYCTGSERVLSEKLLSYSISNF